MPHMHVIEGGGVTWLRIHVVFWCVVVDVVVVVIVIVIVIGFRFGRLWSALLAYCVYILLLFGMDQVGLDYKLRI